ncbi:MAG: hypothetical protein WAW17_06420 [Rhodococcus sp. (in: high G+C Gram-positive bacteria)]|uniref:hypothetical protein n=1 Tax=Rhodococcus sp. TaxID=1831 RepID=UPI003BB0F21C
MPTLAIDAIVAALSLLRPRRYSNLARDVVGRAALTRAQARWVRMCMYDLQADDSAR